MKTLVIVDGNSILNRAFYGVRPLTASDGLFTHAVYGMMNILLRHMENEKPDYAAVAFDMRAPTFRHKLYDGYKSSRKGMPEELAQQLPYAKECCAALGFCLLEKEGYEADDIIGTCAAKAELGGAAAKILTGDRDSLQLITKTTTVLLASTGETAETGIEEFKDKYGITPDRFVDVKALMGDSSDDIPGVKGIGEKTALKLISDFGSIEKLYEELPGAELTKSVREKLEAGRDMAFLSKRLAKIDTNVPLGITLEDLKYRGIDKCEMLRLCTRLELNGLIKRLSLDSAAGGGDTEKNGAPEYRAVGESEMKSMTSRGRWAVSLGGTLRAAGDGVFVECAAKDPWDALALDSPDAEFIMNDVKSFLRSTDRAPKAALKDITLAAYVTDASANSYDLQRLCTAYLARPASGDDARDMAELYPALEEKLNESGQAELYGKIELPLTSVLADMEKKGFMIDRAGLESFGETLAARESECAMAVYEAAGGAFNLNSPKQLAEVLYDRLGLPGGRKTKTGRSTDAETLEGLRPFHPIIDLLLEYRRVTKLRATYADGLLRVADENGKVHTSFKQTVTATGRLSSVEPNLQNIPVRTELGRELRRFFIPESGERVLIDADYSQIELRLLAAVSGDEKMISAFCEGADIHTETAASVFGVPRGEVTPEMRKRAKAVNFGIMYGIGDYSLSRDLGITRRQAADYIESYMSRFPAVRAYLDKEIESAERDGFVTTMFGRRRYIPELASQKKNMQAFGRRVAMNSPIQGAAADIIKLAMINTARALRENGLDAALILQVHDELIVESAKECAERAAEILKSEMENAVKLAVPLTVETGIGKTWYDAH